MDLGKLYRMLVVRSLRPLEFGSLTLVFPDGRREVFGGLGKSLSARIEVRNEDFFRKCVLFGPIGFGESFVDGDWTTPDLTRVIAWFILNSEKSEALETEEGRRPGSLNLLNLYNRILHLRRPNSVEKSRDNIREHYDLGNDFFKLWLDPSLTYSSAVFEPSDATLEAAQEEKYDRLCRKLHISAKDHVLEIGTGWGGFSLHAAGKYGCRITTVTISEEQFRAAQGRIAEAGLSDRVEVVLRDYREITGQFDKIVSIEMLEAVGDRYLETYFAKCHEVLKPHGMLGVQMITCPDRQFRILRDGVDFIQKHIFPGSLLLSAGRVNDAINATGTMNLHGYEDLGVHYAKTLRLWAERFAECEAEVRALGFDDSFLRKWMYYLRYCEAAFATRHISVVQAIYTRPRNLSLRNPVYDLLP